ncbi:hypothetical protein NOR53_3378 [gamma proteobacterium NOR5-3]|nr:hypothetical protein NOR53_3378 [gamma proteobacterium NOR5-3]
MCQKRLELSSYAIELLSWQGGIRPSMVKEIFFSVLSIMRISLQKTINKAIEKLFKSAIDGNRFVLLLLRSSAFLWRAPMGVFEFRRGNISASLRYLENAKLHVNASRLCLTRALEIQKVLDSGPQCSKPPVGSKPFNGKVLLSCHSNGHFHKNGYAIRTSQIANALADQGIEVFACTRLGYPWDLFDVEIEVGAEYTIYEHLKYKHFYDPRKRISGPESEYINEYADLLAQEAALRGVTVIHAHSSYVNGLAACMAAKKIGIVAVYEMRGLWHLSRAVKEPGYSATEHFRYCQSMELTAAKSANKVITLSSAMRDWCVEHGIDFAKITVVPNAIDKKYTETKKVVKAEEENTFRIGFIGSVTEYEGVDDVIKAISQLTPRGYDISLTIAGDGYYLPEVKKLCRSLGLESRVNFVGRISRDKVSELYKNIDLAVVLRKNSPLTRLVPPLKLAESICAGVPTLITNLPPLTEVTGSDISQLIVEPGDIEGIAVRLITLMENRKNLTEIAQQLQQRVEFHYNWSANGKLYNGIYTESCLAASKH